LPTNTCQDREEALRDDYRLDLEGEYGYNDDDEWGEDGANWAAEEAPGETPETTEARDESTAYLEFLNEESQKFSRASNYESEDDLGEESVLLESPLDKVDPYQLFSATLMSESSMALMSVRY
jgi:hypothetical protein